MNVQGNDKKKEVKLGDIVEYDEQFFVVSQCARGDGGAYLDGINLNGHNFVYDIARKIEDSVAKLYSSEDYEIKIVRKG